MRDEKYDDDDGWGEKEETVGKCVPRILVFCTVVVVILLLSLSSFPTPIVRLLPSHTLVHSILSLTLFQWFIIIRELERERERARARARERRANQRRKKNRKSNNNNNNIVYSQQLFVVFFVVVVVELVVVGVVVVVIGVVDIACFALVVHDRALAELTKSTCLLVCLFVCMLACDDHAPTLCQSLGCIRAHYSSRRQLTKNIPSYCSSSFSSP